MGGSKVPLCKDTIAQMQAMFSHLRYSWPTKIMADLLRLHTNGSVFYYRFVILSFGFHEQIFAALNVWLLASRDCADPLRFLDPDLVRSADPDPVRSGSADSGSRFSS